MVKSAFTLIELIFAIVIIGIAVISLPTMNQVTMKGIEGNIVQEAIFAASTELNQVVTANWDDRSLEDGLDSMAKVIDIYTGVGRCETNSSLSTYRQMAGHINQPLHRRCLDTAATTPADANTSSAISLDDTQKIAQNIFSNAAKDKDGYKQNYNADINVTRPAIFDGANRTGVKKIEVLVYERLMPSGNNGKLITKLVTYSSNIGEIDYYKRSY